MSLLTEALRTYSKTLLGLCPLLDVTNKALAEATRATRGHITNLMKGRRSLKPEDEQAVFTLLADAARRLPTHAWPDDHAAVAHLHAIYMALGAFESASLAAEKAHAAWVRARAQPMLSSLEARLTKYSVTPDTHQLLTQQRAAVIALLEDLPSAWGEAATFHMLLKDLADDLASKTIPLTRKVAVVSEVLVKVFGERQWPGSEEKKDRDAGTKRPKGRPRKQPATTLTG